MRRLAAAGLTVALFAVLAASVWSWTLTYQDADEDTGHAVRLARACLEKGDCAAQGTHASGLGLHHGASWIRLIRYFQADGGGLSAVQVVATLLLLLATAVAFATLRRHLSWRAAVLGLLLFLVPTLTTSRFNQLSNALLLPLPLVLYYACLAVFAVSGGTVAAALGGVCLALAMSANLSAVLLAPFHLALVAVLGRRPVPAVLLAGAALAGTFALESADAARHVLRVVGGAAALLAGAALAGALLLAASWRRYVVPLRARLAAEPPAVRVRAAMKAALLYFNTAVWVGCMLVRTDAIPEGQYLGPLVFPLVYLAADASERLTRRRAALLIAIGVAALVALPFAALASGIGNLLMVAGSGVLLVATVVGVIRRRGLPIIGMPLAPAASSLLIGLTALVAIASLPDTLLIRRERQIWPAAAAERLFRGLYDSGLSFAQIMASLQQQAFGTQRHLLATLDPALFDAPTAAPPVDWSLLALQVDADVVPRSEGVMLSIPLGRRAGMVVRAPTFLDRRHLRTCYAETCDAPPDAVQCIERRPEQPLRHDPPYFGVDRSEPLRAGKSFSYQPVGNTYCITFTVPVRTPGAGVAHLLRVVEQWPLTLRITRVEGIEYEGTLPAAEIRLPDRQAGEGSIDVQVVGEGLGADADWLEDPPLIEVTAGNEHLLEPFRRLRATLW